MSDGWLIPLAATAAGVVIGAVVVGRGRRDRTVWTFAFMTACLAAWNLGLFLLQVVADPVRAEWLTRLTRVGICLAPVASFHFAIVLTSYDARAWRALLAAGYVAAGGLAVLGLAGFLVDGVRPAAGWGWYPQPTRLYAALTALLALYPTLSVLLMARRWCDPQSPRQRAQVTCWFVGGIVQVALLATNVLRLYDVPVYPLGSAGTVAFQAAIAYAIVRHRFMDADVLVRKVVGFSLSVAAVLVPGAVGIAALAERHGSHDPLALALAAGALGLVAAAVVPALQRGIETRVERTLFPGRSDARRRLRALATALVSELDEPRLLRRLGGALGEVLALEACAVAVHDESTHRFEIAYPAVPAPPLAPDVVAALEPLCQPALVDELAVGAPAAAAALRAGGWSVVLPLRTNDRLGAVALLAGTRDPRLVSSEILELLGGVAAAAGVALANARLSHELRRSEAVLHRATRLSSLGMLAAGIASEIRNPLSAVETYLELLPQRLGDADFVRTFRERSLEELRRVADLVTDLIALGRSGQGRRTAVGLAACLEPVIRLIEAPARSRHVALAARLGADLGPVWADPDELKQIALNLLLNAVEASPPGSTVTVEAMAGDAGDAWLFVHDRGAGMSADRLEAIFQPFSTGSDGASLGLALVHQMVVEGGGEIAVDSAPGLGTCFRIRLPGAPAAATAAREPRGAAPDPPAVAAAAQERSNVARRAAR